MKALILLLVVACVGCETTSVKTPKPTTTSWVSDPSDPNNVKIEAAIRYAAKKPTGELTKADLEKVTVLFLNFNQLTDVTALKELTQLKGLNLNINQLTDVTALKEPTQLTWLRLSDNQLTDVTALKELTQLTFLDLTGNPDLTKAQIVGLQKALPKCNIVSNPIK